MWSDFEMLVMALCCIGLGFTVGVDFKAAQVKKNRLNKRFGLKFGASDLPGYQDTDSIKPL